MKEVTVWDNKPRYMWVWDNDEDIKCKNYVVCILTIEQLKETKSCFPVISLGGKYNHCAEIEEPTKRPCAREELLEMLKKQGLPMLKSNLDGVNYVVTVITGTLCHVYDCGDYNYQGLCDTFTLLDGTELWVEE